MPLEAGGRGCGWGDWPWPVPWTLPIQSPLGALCWCGVMLAALAFVASLAGRTRTTKLNGDRT